MNSRQAERRIYRAVADTVEGLGLKEFIGPQELEKLSLTEALLLQTEFRALIAELRRRGAELGVEPELDSPTFDPGNLSDGKRKNRSS
jgi:hypothetical protein